MPETLQVTPSGIGILFESGEPHPDNGFKDNGEPKSKKRAYTIAQLPTRPSTEAPTDRAAYVREHGSKLPSVTTILGMLDKPGLKWWSEKLAVEGCIVLARDGGLPIDVDAALGQLTRNGLRHFQVSEQKAARGKLSHEDLVKLAAGEALPALDTYPVDQRMFAQGLAGIIADLRPTIHESEQMCASLEYGYAGRPDLVVTLGAKTLPDGTAAPRGRGLIDLKTVDKWPRTEPSKRYPDGNLKTPYPENLFQLGLYEVARRESGYEPTDWQAVVRVGADGHADFTCSWLEPERALEILPAYRAFKDAGQRVKTANDQRPVGLGIEVAA